MALMPIPKKVCTKDDEKGSCCKDSADGFMWPIDYCPKCGSLYYKWLTYEEMKHEET